MKRVAGRKLTVAAHIGLFFVLGGLASAAPPPALVKSTESALTDQIACRARPQVARSINAMLRNGLIRYVDNESGIYLFAPTVPMAFLGFQITHISGFDQDEPFRRVPYSRMVGTAPPHFIEIDVLASASELKRRARAAGMVEAVPAKGIRGFDVQSLGSYLASPRRPSISSIECAD